MMTTLYHYSDVNGFFNIVRHKKLWLSGPHNLNDHQELQWAYRKISQTFTRLSSDYSKEHLELLWTLYKANPLIPFICSLSSNGDLLSQWRAYSKDGTGVALGFDLKSLPNTGHLPHYNVLPEYSITTQKVIYEGSDQDAAIEKTLVTALEKMKGNPDYLAEPAVQSVPFTLNGLATLYKNDAFREECEWRIIHTPMIKTALADMKTDVMSAVSPLNHRVSNDKIISYFEYDFSGLVESGIINSVILGPKCPISKYDLDLFLISSGLNNIMVNKSSASYR